MFRSDFHPNAGYGTDYEVYVGTLRHNTSSRTQDSTFNIELG